MVRTLSSASSWSFGSMARFGGGGEISDFDVDEVSSALTDGSTVSDVDSCSSVDEDGCSEVEFGEFEDEGPESISRSCGYAWNGRRKTRLCVRGGLTIGIL